jgi:hypothetical protein
MAVAASRVTSIEGPFWLRSDAAKAVSGQMILVFSTLVFSKK